MDVMNKRTRLFFYGKFKFSRARISGGKLTGSTVHSLSLSFWNRVKKFINRTQAQVSCHEYFGILDRFIPGFLGTGARLERGHKYFRTTIGGNIWETKLIRELLFGVYKYLIFPYLVLQDRNFNGGGGYFWI